jgi:hypothetical protein
MKADRDMLRLAAKVTAADEDFRTARGEKRKAAFATRNRLLNQLKAMQAKAAAATTPAEPPA